MLKSYFRITWRNLLKDRQFTALNLIGLSVGLACTLLIGLWVADELHMDKYNEKDAQLYQVMGNFKTDAGIKTGTHTSGILAPALKKEIPEIEEAVTVFPASWFSTKGTLTAGDKHLKADGQYVSRDYFDVFTCPFLEGDRNRLFADKLAVAISDQMAKKVFGTTTDVIGKTIKFEQSEFTGSFVITGIFQHNPSNATEQFDLIFNFDLALERRDGLQKWYNSDPSTYVIVKKGTDINQLNAKIRDFLQSRSKYDPPTLFLTRFSDRYLHDHYENGVQTGGRITYVKLFSIVAAFILIIACINFMNLSTAKAAHRAREVGIKKVVGASRRSLILQYLGESVLLSLLSLILAVGLLTLLLPVFNEITGKTLLLPVNPGVIGTVLGITFFTGLLAGSYPAFYLSAFRPVAVLKGKIRTSWSELWTRKGLVVFQFTLSVIFIAAVLIVYRQVEYIQSKNLGYNKDHILHFEIPSMPDSAGERPEISFINEVQNIPGVINVSSYYHTLTGLHGEISGVEWPGRPAGADIHFANLEVGFHFLKTMGIPMKEGRETSPDAANARNEIVFNETAIRMMGLKDPIGKTIRFWGHDRKIVGVAADFNFESLYQNIKPCFFQEYPVTPNVIVKVRAGSERATIAAIRTIYAKFNPGLAFEYRFMDQDYQALYASEQRVGLLSRYFAGLAILISCLGLFGLAAFTAQKRKKELGIRKVVGASVLQLAFLLSREFLALVFLAICIAFPLVYLGMHRWLDSFAYRTSISADVFIRTGLAALAITLLTIGYQALKAASMNPVETLRSE
jgi:putative ABC transport system permease protein